MLFYPLEGYTGREHTKNEGDEFYICADVLCSSYLRIFNSHTHTYLDGDTILM